MVELSKHAARFSVSADDIKEYLRIKKHIEVSRFRVHWALYNTQKISPKEYRFLYYIILNIEVDRIHQNISITELKARQKYHDELKYYHAIKHHIPDCGGESCRRHLNTEYW